MWRGTDGPQFLKQPQPEDAPPRWRLWGSRGWGAAWCWRFFCRSEIFCQDPPPVKVDPRIVKKTQNLNRQLQKRLLKSITKIIASKKLHKHQKDIKVHGTIVPEYRKCAYLWHGRRTTRCRPQNSWRLGRSRPWAASVGGAWEVNRQFARYAPYKQGIWLHQLITKISSGFWFCSKIPRKKVTWSISARHTKI